MCRAARFRDRADAGRALAELLSAYAGRDDVVVLGLPRGGVPVAYEVARRLGVPLDVLVVRKLGVPGHEELAMGAIAGSGVRVVNHDVVRELGLSEAAIDAVAAREEEEVRRREATYRSGRPTLDVAGRVVIVVDDGLATGATMRAAVAALKTLAPKRVVVGVPTAAPPVRDELAREANEVVCVITPEPFGAVGFWYDDFAQTTDDEIHRLLAA